MNRTALTFLVPLTLLGSAQALYLATTWASIDAMPAACTQDARAALQLPGVDPATKVALAGYSQGGAATAAAAELIDDYAPDLAEHVVGQPAAQGVGR